MFYLNLIDQTSARMLFAYNRIQHINMHFFVSKDSMFSNNPRCFQKEILFRSLNMIHRHFHLWPWHCNESEYLGSNWPIIRWELARIQQTNLYHALFFWIFLNTNPYHQSEGKLNLVDMNEKLALIVSIEWILDPGVV